MLFKSFLRNKIVVKFIDEFIFGGFKFIIIEDIDE